MTEIDAVLVAQLPVMMDAVQALIDAAVPGPWEVDGTEVYGFGLDANDGSQHWACETLDLIDEPRGLANAQLIGASVNGLSEMLAEDRKLWALYGPADPLVQRSIYVNTVFASMARRYLALVPHPLEAI